MTESNQHPNLAILILAAGESKRMGRSKQLLKWGNSTLLNHSIEQATNTNASAVFVVLGANYSAIEKSILNRDINIFKYDDWNLGMGSTIAFGVNQLKNQCFDGFLLMLADQPQIGSSFLNKLIFEFAQGDNPIIATAYNNEAGVPAVFDKSYVGQLLSLSGKRGAMQLINKSTSNVKKIKAEQPVGDIDTIKDYEELYKLNFKTTSSL